MIFPKTSNTAYVTLNPKKEMNLSTFTICMRFLTDLNQDYALFSYASPGKDNDLLLFRTSQGNYNVYIGNEFVSFTHSRSLNFGEWVQVCSTWESQTGLVGLWVDGKRSVRKGLMRGYKVKPGGAVILGQEQDKMGGGFVSEQSFAGEITDVNLWDYILPANEIKALSAGSSFTAGNVIDWETVSYTENGYVVVESMQKSTTNNNN
ncbi:mucosal pentraxin-like [Latimeria chalumnae]